MQEEVIWSFEINDYEVLYFNIQGTRMYSCTAWLIMSLFYWNNAKEMRSHYKFWKNNISYLRAQTETVN